MYSIFTKFSSKAFLIIKTLKNIVCCPLSVKEAMLFLNDIAGFCIHLCGSKRFVGTELKKTAYVGNCVFAILLLREKQYAIPLINLLESGAILYRNPLRTT